MDGEVVFAGLDGVRVEMGETVVGTDCVEFFLLYPGVILSVKEDIWKF